MRSFLILYFLLAFSSMTVAVRGPWNYVPAWNPTVQLVTEEAAKQLMGPTAYVVYIMHATGRDWLDDTSRWYHCRVDFTIGPWPRTCRAYLSYPSRGVVQVLKQWGRPWGRSMCWY